MTTKSDIEREADVTKNSDGSEIKNQSLPESVLDHQDFKNL